MIFPSILDPSDRAYELVADSWDFYQHRGNGPILHELMAFRTFGDGTTQHSGAHCAQFADLIDVCLSLTSAILADPSNKRLEKTAFKLCAVNRAQIRFALGVQFKEGKRQFYSASEQKIGSSEKLRNDRRYELVNEYLDGSAKSAFRILSADHHDYFTRLLLAKRCRDMDYELNDRYSNWEELFPPVAELKRDWQSAFDGLVLALEGAQALERARSTFDCVAHNLRPRPEPTPEVTTEATPATA